MGYIIFISQSSHLCPDKPVYTIKQKIADHQKSDIYVVFARITLPTDTCIGFKPKPDTW